MKAPAFLAQHASHVEQVLVRELHRHQSVVPDHLWEAMNYSLTVGGKRVRPALLMACFNACGGQGDQTDLAAAAIECIHTYSLIHDDLPCMDDDSLRRGQPTCHIKFDEATAVLAGDALQTLAFELLTQIEIDAETRLELLHRLAVAAGAQGMVAGQVMDMQSEHHGSVDDGDLLHVEQIHLRKTGALICWSCEAGALLAGADAAHLEMCSRYGKAVGLLFQIADDILDATADTETLGKSAGKDEAQDKLTYVSVLGLGRARELAREMYELAIEACDQLKDDSTQLRELAQYILERGK